MNGFLWPAIPALVILVLQLFFIGVILSRQKPNPAATLAWIVVILAVPLVGFALYLLIGEVRLGRRRIERHREIVRRIVSRATPPRDVLKMMRPEVPMQYRAIASLGESVSNHVVQAGNAVDFIHRADDMARLMVEDIDAASHHCHLLYYIYLTDEIGQKVAEALARAAKRGVSCRLLVDAVGSRSFLRSALSRELKRAGVQVVDALPANLLRVAFSRVDLRNHRKITIIDGKIAYTGSHNIACEDFAPKKKYSPWHDISVRVQGPIVRDLQMIFVEDWYLDTDESLEELLDISPGVIEDGVAAQIMGSGPNAYNEAMRQLKHAAFHTAREELLITTPYFVPDEATATAICSAARRGVETTLIVPARNDSRLVAIASRSYYDMLLEAGVRVHEYQDGLLHAKTMTIDRELALVSTANLDRRSFELNFEVSVAIYDSDCASQLRYLQRSYLSRSKPVRLKAWRQRGLPRRLWQNAIGILSPLL